uniref:Uncharacterized protein n=1 Tax=Arundo donax TaxID=35708 RepID=A0A0A9HPS4_ARUDO
MNYGQSAPQGETVCKYKIPTMTETRSFCDALNLNGGLSAA